MLIVVAPVEESSKVTNIKDKIYNKLKQHAMKLPFLNASMWHYVIWPNVNWSNVIYPTCNSNVSWLKHHQAQTIMLLSVEWMETKLTLTFDQLTSVQMAWCHVSIEQNVQILLTKSYHRLLWLNKQRYIICLILN